MNAIDALKKYKAKGERVDEVLFQIVTSEIELLLKRLARSEIYLMKLVVDKDKENKQLREALTKILDYNTFDLAKFETEVIAIARQALAGESDEK